MLDDEFSKLRKEYDLAKVYAAIGDFDRLGSVRSGISKFLETRPINEDEVEYVFRSEKVIDRHVSGIVEGHFASLWECALNGDSRIMALRTMGCLEYFNDLQSKGVLSSNVMNCAGERFDEIWSIYNSSAYMSNLEDFNDACMREDGDDIMFSFYRMKTLCGDSIIKGPRRDVELD
ncbi:hypothetical protein HN903_03180 [archaeon]|jgi:hypothetical protein|nr:hypothetical protein [archaeon]MBT7128733.1 hypothetical protein [archaeon]